MNINLPINETIGQLTTRICVANANDPTVLANMKTAARDGQIHASKKLLICGWVQVFQHYLDLRCPVCLGYGHKYAECPLYTQLKAAQGSHSFIKTAVHEMVNARTPINSIVTGARRGDTAVMVRIQMPRVHTTTLGKR